MSEGDFSGISGEDFGATSDLLGMSGEDFSTTSGEEFSGMTLPVVFESGMIDGSMACANVSLSMDSPTEFTVELTLDTVQDCLILGAATTTVTILQDRDGKCLYFLSDIAD